MVGEPFVVAAAEGHVDCGLDAVGPVRAEQQPEQLAVQLVHDVVVRLELSGGGDVPGGDHGARLGHDPLGHLAHLHDGGAQLDRDGRVRVPQTGQFGDVPGQVAHPLQVGGHPQAGHDGPQIGGDGLLPGQQFEGLLLDGYLQGVDLLVGGDDRLGQFEVGVQERTGSPVDCGPDQSGHLYHMFGEAGQFAMELLTHGRNLPGCRERRPCGR